MIARTDKKLWKKIALLSARTTSSRGKDC